MNGKLKAVSLALILGLGACTSTSGLDPQEQYQKGEVNKGEEVNQGSVNEGNTAEERKNNDLNLGLDDLKDLGLEIDGDLDNDGIPDVEDTDKDGDGIPDIDDADIDGDGIKNEDDPDIDGDGIPNEEDPDIDGDGIKNIDDNDIDGDGIPNTEDPDLDGDGIPNTTDPDIDGDGIPNGQDNDIDGDGIPNDQDSDMDGDGIPNDQDPDADGDGIKDGETDSAITIKASDDTTFDLGVAPGATSFETTYDIDVQDMRDEIEEKNMVLSSVLVSDLAVKVKEDASGFVASNANKQVVVRIYATMGGEKKEIMYSRRPNDDGALLNLGDLASGISYAGGDLMVSGANFNEFSAVVKDESISAVIPITMKVEAVQWSAASAASVKFDFSVEATGQAKL